MNVEIAEVLCRRFEGFRAKPYLCPAGIPTIGYGTTVYPNGRMVTLQDKSITEQEARAMLMYELLNTFAPGVIRQCPILLTLAIKTNDWRKLNAIIDFAYNLGVGRLQTSTLKRKINAQDWNGVKEQLNLWVRGGGRIQPGLVTRRQVEASLIG